jgi:hypothetical protein
MQTNSCFFSNASRLQFHIVHAFFERHLVVGAFDYRAGESFFFFFALVRVYAQRD